MRHRPRLHIVTTGGTIASKVDPDTGAVVPVVGGDELVARMPQLHEQADVELVEVALVSSWDVTPTLMAEVARRVVDVIAAGSDGVVVTHGTDTMEETAFALHLLCDVEAPVVLTGAMRNADQPGADGPANLLAAATVATDPAARGLAGVVVMNDQVHAARHVHKTHTTAVGTFASPGIGPLGTIDADGLALRWRPAPLPRLTLPHPDVALDRLHVPLVKMAAGLDPQTFAGLLAGDVDGLVVEGSGSGNVPAPWQVPLRALVEAGVPVVLASRCEAGRVVASYGGAGGGKTLTRLGVIPAGDLGGPKARLALIFALASGADLAGVREWFAAAACSSG